MTRRDDEIKTAANRATALAALAAGGQDPAGNCLSSEAMAALVAGNLANEERQHCLDHLAKCQSCYDQWRALSLAEMAEPGKIIKGPWYSKRSFSFAAAGSLLAAAASLLLYLNLTPPSLMNDQAPFSRSVESEYPSEVVSDEPQTPAAKAPPSLLLEKEGEAVSGLVARQEAKKKESMTDQDMAVSGAPVKSKRAAPRRMRSAVRFEEEKSAEDVFAALTQENEEMVDIGNVIPVVLKKMTQLGEGQSLILQTYKRDRSLTLIRLAGERVLIKEEGFSQEEFEVDMAKLRKALKTLLKKEFPRSNKVRISAGGQPD